MGDTTGSRSVEAFGRDPQSEVLPVSGAARAPLPTVPDCEQTILDALHGPSDTIPAPPPQFETEEHKTIP